MWIIFGTIIIFVLITFFAAIFEYKISEWGWIILMGGLISAILLGIVFGY